MPPEVNGRLHTAKTAIIGAIVGVVGTAVLGATGFALRDRDRVMSEVAMLDKTVALNSRRIESVEVAQMSVIETNTAILKELKAIRIALAGGGVRIEVDP